jgi:hypothetical protein
MKISNMFFVGVPHLLESEGQSCFFKFDFVILRNEDFAFLSEIPKNVGESLVFVKQLKSSFESNSLDAF